MTDHQELKRLAEAATPGPWYVQYGDDASHRCMTAVSTHNKRLNNQGCFTEAEFESLIAITLHQSYPWVDPDCVNDDANSAYIAAASPDVVLSMIAEIDRLRTQNQALMEALERMVESVTGVDQVSAVNQARTALAAAKQAQPERAPLSADAYEALVEDLGEWSRHVVEDTAHITLDTHIRRTLAVHGIKQGGQHEKDQ